jgi:hypothetical protein
MSYESESVDDVVIPFDPRPGAQARKDAGVSLDDFYAYMPARSSFIFMPTREMWPSTSVDARLGPVPCLDANGQPDLDENGQQKTQPASKWIAQNRCVEQMTWAPGKPALIKDRLISDGGRIERPDVATLNLYKPPTIKQGDLLKAEPWTEHIRKVFGGDAKHIIFWLAHRVQRPHEKINHALVLGGKQGIGKDTLLESVRGISPRYHLST